jgi:UDP-N-acetylmuramate dehydrogenase
MPSGAVRPNLEDFAEITKREEPLAPYTALKVGGPAEFFVQPRSREELTAVLRRCVAERLAVRVLGGGCKLLVRDEGVRGVVLRLSEPGFTLIQVEGRLIQTGSGASLPALISEAARNGLAGLESLVGIPGTVGGALRVNAGERSGEIGQFVRRVESLDERGQLLVRERDELSFAYRWSNLDDPVLLAAEFELEKDLLDVIVKRLRKAWIQRKSSHPLSFQPAAQIFKNPRGLSAASLLAQAGLTETRVGGAELSERDANFVVVHPGTSSHDVLRLIDLARSRVRERAGVELDLELAIW